MMATNLNGVIPVTQAFIPVLKCIYGAIMNMASIFWGAILNPAGDTT